MSDKKSKRALLQEIRNEKHIANIEHQGAAPKSVKEKMAKAKYVHMARMERRVLKDLKEAQSTDSNQ